MLFEHFGTCWSKNHRTRKTFIRCFARQRTPKRSAPQGIRLCSNIMLGVFKQYVRCSEININIYNNRYITTNYTINDLIVDKTIYSFIIYFIIYYICIYYLIYTYLYIYLYILFILFTLCVLYILYLVYIS